MTVSAADPSLLALAKALGLLDADGNIDPEWFNSPMARLQTIIDNPIQRRGLFDLLDTALPADDRGAPGQQWHPLVEADRYGLYLTVEGDVIGVAGRAGLVDTDPAIDLTLRLPLVDASQGLTVIAGTPQGPLELAVNVAALGIDASVVAQVDGEGAGVKLVLRDVDLGDGVPRNVEMDPAALGGDAALALLALLRTVLAEAGDPAEQLTTHLPGVLGLAPGLPPLPIDRLITDPAAFRSWLADLAGRPDGLAQWFGHLTGLLGAESTVTGKGTESEPWRAEVFTEGAVSVALELGRGSSDGRLLIGLDVGIDGPSMRVEAGATVVGIPLTGTAPATVLPSAYLRVAATPPLPASGPVTVGSVLAGLRWNGDSLAPQLTLHDVVLEEHHYDVLDLSDTDAVVAAASDAIGDAITAALGTTGPGHALAALLGLVPPTSDPDSPHRLSITGLAAAPTRAIADFHRAVLDDPDHPWLHLLVEIAELLGISTVVIGTGEPADPWRVAIATDGATGLHLAAWDTPLTEAGVPGHGLRLGLVATAETSTIAANLRVGLIGFDLRDGPTTTWLVPEVGVDLGVVPPALVTDAGTGFDLERVEIALNWRPGGDLRPVLRVVGLSLLADGDIIGPLDLQLTATPDLTAADLGVGIPPDLLGQVLGLLVREAADSWGGPPAVVLTALLGLHRRLPGLPPDWPLVWPQATDLAALLRDPVPAFGSHLRRVTTESSADGVPFAAVGLPWLTALMDGRVHADGLNATLDALPVGWGTEAHPWRVQLPADERVEVLLWVSGTRPGQDWVNHTIGHLIQAADGAELLDRLAVTAGAAPAVTGALAGRDHARLAMSLDTLDRWLADSDGLVPVTAQTAVPDNWATSDLIVSTHHDLPAHPEAVAAVAAQVNAWAPDARCVVLISAPFGDHQSWAPLLDEIDPQHPADAHVQLRVADPHSVNLAEVRTVASAYTIDLAGSGVDDGLAQLEPAIEHLRALTGQDEVILVAHSTAGLVAVSYAAVHPDQVTGVITVATPHGGSPLGPLGTDDYAAGLADAVRFAASAPAATHPAVTLQAVAQLAAALDAAPTGPEIPGATTFPVAAFNTAFTTCPAPGLAVCGVAGTDLGGSSGLVTHIAAAVADELDQQFGGPAEVASGLAVGLRVRPDLPVDDERIHVGATVRVPLTQVRFASEVSAPQPGPMSVVVDLDVSDGWLVGTCRPETDPRRARVRRACLGVEIIPGAGGPQVQAVANLHDAFLATATPRLAGPAVTRPLVGFAEAVATLPADDTATVGFGPLPAAETAAALVVEALRTAGLVTAEEFTAGALRSLAATPAAWLSPRAVELAALLLPAVGFTAADDGPWVATLPTLAAELTLTPTPWTAALTITDAARSTASGVQASGTLALPAGVTRTSATLWAGAGSLVWDANLARLTAQVEGWTEPVVLLPTPTSPGVPAEVATAAVMGLASSLISAVADGLLPGGVRLREPARLLRDPLGVLRDAFTDPGGGIDAAAVGELLQAAARFLDLADATADGDPGIVFPGGFAVHTATAPARLLVSGTVDLGGDDSFELGIGVLLAEAGAPVGELELTVALPGTWGGVMVAIGADAHGLALSVTPTGLAPIHLLPQVDGVAALGGAAARLLPQVLQAIVEQLRADGLTGPVFDAVLDVAASLGIYVEDADGFRRPDCQAELAAMIQPGWLDGRSATVATAAATALADLLRAAEIGFADVEVDQGLVRCSIDTGVGLVRVEAGWTGAVPTLLVGLDGVQLGPAELETVTVGYNGDLNASVRVGLRAGSPVAFLRPSLEVTAAIDLTTGAPRVGVAVLPFGDDGRDEAAVTLAPVPGVVLTTEAAVLIVEQWGVPLAALVGVTGFEERVRTPLWDAGPSVLEVLTATGLVVAGSDPIALAATPPPIEEMALRGLAALADGLSLPLGDLHLGLVTETETDGSSRYGVRLSGRADLAAGDVLVSTRFGDTDWLSDEPDAGISVWLLRQNVGADLPHLRPVVELLGLGAVVTGTDGPLLDTSLRIGGAGIFLFGEIAFTDVDGTPEISVDALGLGGQLDESQLVISAADADSFITQILPSDLSIGLDLAVSWREGQGLRLHRAAAAGGLEVTVPVDLDAVILKVTELWMKLAIVGDTTHLHAAVSGRADLGPLHLTVTRVGMEARFRPTGNEVVFRAPDGAGLSLDVGVVAGGGYLAHDEQLGQYSGAVALQFASVGLKAVGVITTKNPDGTPGFSLLIIISAEFTPIQLGFGFTLTGVGGLLGLNRTADVAALRSGVRDGTLGSILFPTDLVENAPKIVSDLVRVFPQAEGRFLVGPMAKIGWGTPTLVSVTLGIVLDLPSPIRLIVLGRVNVALPTPDEAVVQLNLDLLGVLDFDRKELSFDASLYDSRIAAFDVTGDMALRASWGESPMFALSAGGFHPRFTPPPGFPVLRRLAISLATGDNPRIRLESYLALTSNTAQFGARLELYAQACGFTIEGWLAFDALLQFDPFGFEVEISGGVALKSGQCTLLAVQVELYLSGPKPWHARGSATAVLAGIAIPVAFDVTVGQPGLPPAAEPIEVAELLEVALRDPRSWSAQLPASPSDNVYSLRSLDLPADVLVIHPLGSLSFTQRVVPLSTTIERYGTAPIMGDYRFEVYVRVGDHQPVVAQVLEEQFAPGQFFALSDDDRLRQPAFQARPAGQRLERTGSGRDHWLVRAAALDYEQKVIDDSEVADDPLLLPRTLVAVATARPLLMKHLDAAISSSPVARGTSRATGRHRFSGATFALHVSEGR